MADVQHLDRDPFVRNLIRCKARQVVGKAGLTSNDVPDIEQELFRRFWERLRRCKGELPNPHAFVTMAVNQSLRNYLRDRSAQKRCPDRLTSLSASVADGDSRPVDLAQIVSDQEQSNRTRDFARSSEEVSDLAGDVNAVLAGAPPYLQALAEKLKGGDSIQRIAQDLGLPRTTVNDHIRRLRQIFERARLREYL